METDFLPETDSNIWVDFNFLPNWAFTCVHYTHSLTEKLAHKTVCKNR